MVDDFLEEKYLSWDFSAEAPASLLRRWEVFVGSFLENDWGRP